MEALTGIIIVVVAIVVIVLLLKIITAPMKLIFKLLIHALLGFAALFILNFFSSMIGVTIALTWLNALIAGVLGIPGVLILFILALVL